MGLAFRKIGMVTKRLRRVAVPVDRVGGVRPLLVNSFPKSGTHLLYQVAEGLGPWTDYGTFLVHATSFRFREIPSYRVDSRMRSLRPGELCRGHLRAAPTVVTALQERDVLCATIVRDPRDVVVSEAHYLTGMNPWHRLSRYFRPLKGDLQGAVAQVIRGLPGGGPTGLFPNVAARLEPFLGWLEQDAVHVVRYEELRSDLRSGVAALVRWLAAQGVELPPEAIDRAVRHVSPRRSHTFRSGRAGGWRDEMSPENVRLFEEIAGDVTRRLGYGSA